MKINKQKLIEALKILKLTPSKTISILNANNSRHLCYTDIWRKTTHGKCNVKFITDPHAHPDLPELSIPSCIILSKEEIKRAKSIAYSSKYQQSALLSEFLFDNPIEKLKLIEVLNSIKEEETKETDKLQFARNFNKWYIS